MTKLELLVFSQNLRNNIQELRAKGYKFSFFFSVINCSSTKFYNFMRGYNNLSEDELTRLQIRINEAQSIEEGIRH